MNYGELKRALRKIGCYKDSEGSRHEMWTVRSQATSFPSVATIGKRLHQAH